MVQGRIAHVSLPHGTPSCLIFLIELNELTMLGDKEAGAILDRFENLRTTTDYRGLWEFESGIPKLASDKFELLSNIETSDIIRLFREDRSRCAHPSMISIDEPFEATADWRDIICAVRSPIFYASARARSSGKGSD